MLQSEQNQTPKDIIKAPSLERFPSEYQKAESDPNELSKIPQMPNNNSSLLYQPSQTFESSSIFQTVSKKPLIYDQNMKRVNKAFSVFLIGNDENTSRTKFLHDFIPESFIRGIKEQFDQVLINDFNEVFQSYVYIKEEHVLKDFLKFNLPVIHHFTQSLPVIFLFDTDLDGDQYFEKEDGTMIWFCENGNRNSLAYLKTIQQETKGSILSKLANFCLIVLEKEEENQNEEDYKLFQKELEEFSALLKTNIFKFPVKNPKASYTKLQKYLTVQITEILKEKKEKIMRIKENAIPNPKLDRFFLSDLACFFIKNNGIIPYEILEKKAFLMMGRPNDLLFSQFKKSLDPYLEKYKVIFQKSLEENINKPSKLKILRPIRRNPIVLEEKSKFILSESEAKDLILLFWEYSHYNVLKTSSKSNKPGVISIKNAGKEHKSAMYIKIDSRLKAYLGFPITENYLEIKDFLEKNMSKIKETYTHEYNDLINKRHKAPKPKPFYKGFDPLKRDFHGQELSKLISKQPLDELAEFLIRKSPLEKPDGQNLKILTGFIGIKETKHLNKKLERVIQDVNEQKIKQKNNINIVENIKEGVKKDELLGNLDYINGKPSFEEWGLVYLKSSNVSNEAITLFKEKNPRLMKRFINIKKTIKLTPLEYEENSQEFLKKIKKCQRIILLITEETPSNTDALKKFLEKNLLLSKRSLSLHRISLIILFFNDPNTKSLESFEDFIKNTYGSLNINISLQEESLISIKSYFEFQAFSKLSKIFEKKLLTAKSNDKPDLNGILSCNSNSKKIQNLNYEGFIEILSGRLFPGETMNRELMDDLFYNWFLKHETNFDIVDFNTLYQKALKKINRLSAMLEGKIEILTKKEQDLKESLESHKENTDSEEFLAVKIEEITGINDKFLKKKKNNLSFMLEIYYGEDRANSNRFAIGKTFKINEKFLLKYQKNENFLIRLKQIEDKNSLDGLSFILSSIELTKPEELVNSEIKELILCSETTDSEINSINIKIKFKHLLYTHERILIKQRKFEEVLSNLKDYLAQIYNYKYELLGLFTSKASENASYLSNHLSFIEQLNFEPKKINKNPPLIAFDEEIAKLSNNVEAQKKQIQALETLQSNESKEKLSLETEIKRLQELLQALQQDNFKEKAGLEAQIQKKNKNLEDLSCNQSLNEKKLSILVQCLADIQKKMAEKDKEKQVIQDKRSEIIAFFTASKNAGYPVEKLRKLQEYFLYLQKSILKFYNKAIIIEADVFEMKASTLKAGLGCLAGSVPFIGNMLKFIIETAIDIKKAWDEHKFVRKCIKFSNLIHSQRILSEITEEMAFEIIKDPKKQELILEASEIKSSTMDKLKEKLMDFFKKTKDFFSRKKKNKTQEKLLKDLDTPAKLLGNIDGGYLCTQAVEFYKEEYMKFDPEDPYNKKGLVQLFISVITNIDNKIYEKVISFEEMKDFKGINEFSEEKLIEKIASVQESEVTHEEINQIALEDPVSIRKIEETNEELSVFKLKQEKNEKKLMELIEEHNTQNEKIEIHDKRLNDLEKQAILGLNYLGGLNQEIYDLKERIKNLYSSMNVKYQEIIKKMEEGDNGEDNSEASSLLKKFSKGLSVSEKINKNNDPFFMYLEKNNNKLKNITTVGSGLKTPIKQLLTPLIKK